jgi:hypothetical protein
MHEKPFPQGYLGVCRWSAVVRAALVGGLVVVAAVGSACVNLTYPTGAQADGGAFVPHQRVGQACRIGADCVTGFCFDKVCCAKACPGDCFTCAKDGFLGTCLPADVGTNPRSTCADDGMASCGQTGGCDGTGFCQKYMAGLTCAAATCSGASLVSASRCDGNGTCAAGVSQACMPYVCGTDGKCLTACATVADCAGRGPCTNGTCGKKAVGTACADLTECDSGFCAQGVCCATACTGNCMSCGLTGSAGTCTPQPAGVLSASCATTDVSMCGTDGTCDGAGGCRLYQLGTMCSLASCSTATLHNAGKCDGKGNCQVPTATTCGGYTCATATACRTSCAMDADCASPSVCNMPQSSCGGLAAQYFRQTNLTDLAFSRTDPQINFNWGGVPPSPLLNAANFAIRWTGKLTPRFNETYTFYAATDDGERLWVGDLLIIDHYVRHSTIPEDVSKTMMLAAGVAVDVKMEYFQSGGDASAVLSWSSASETKAVIPTSAFAPQ